ncbi:MAG: hypothetical protein AB4040_15020, partial [Synechococcus sp.]
MNAISSGFYGNSPRATMVLSLILAHVESASRLTALLNGQFTPAAFAAGIALAYVFGAVHA